MRNPFAVLRRLSGRTDNTVIATLYSHCIGRPLLVEPRRGEALLAAYMQGAVDEVAPREPQTVEKIAVMNISGALASRPMPGPSGPGPMNYEELRLTFDELVERADVDAIVLRLDSPGGFADGLLDFTDQIAAARSAKPIHAVVEHMAFSAAYAIAAAAEVVWVTRTSGTGSVGAVAYHVDRSAANEMDGLKVTAIYAGARKIDFSPHFPLSEEAFVAAQADIDLHNDFFVNAVAKYRSMDPQRVRDTEAALFTGSAGIDVGFADRVGTLYDALAMLAGTDDVEIPEPDHEDETMDDLTDEQKAKNEAQRIRGVLSEAVFSADIPPALQAALMKCDIGEEEIEGRLKHASEVHDLCTIAGHADLAAGFVAKNTAPDDVRKQLTEKKAAAQQEIDVTLPAINGAGKGRVASTWDNTIRKFGGTP